MKMIPLELKDSEQFKFQQNFPQEAKRAILNDRDSLQTVISRLNDFPLGKYKNTASEEVLCWQDAGLFYSRTNRYYEALVIFENLYHKLIKAQLKYNIWLHKGMPLVWMRDQHMILSRPWLAQRYILLTLIEDSIREKGSISAQTSGVYFRIIWQQGIPENTYKKLVRKSYEIYEKDKKKGMFPEWILSKMVGDFTWKYPVQDELDICKINIPFAELWFKQIYNQKNANKKGHEFEDFIGYLMGCIPGFEVQTRIRSNAYEFDGLIRNKGLNTDFRSDFGNYILFECKNWEQPVGTSELAYFATKMQMHDCRTGILFSKEGITGSKSNKDALSMLSQAFHRQGRIIMVLDKDDILNAIRKNNLILILQQKYESARFNLPLKS